MSGCNGYSKETSPDGRVTLRFASGQGVVSSVVRDVAGILAREGLQGGLVEDAAIALAEALNNIEEHAYAGRTGLPVHVDIAVHPTRFECRIEDRGDPLPEGALPGDKMPKSDPAAHEQLPEGGFGWALLRRVTSELTYRRSGDWNRLSFTVS